MIFTSLGLLAVALGLLIAGIAKSSVALLMTSLVCTVAAGIVLATVLPAARRLNAATGGGTAPIQSANGQPVVLYLQQAPATTAASNGSNGSNGPVIDLTSAPIVGYDGMTAQQITKLISSGALTDDQLDALREYEEAHAARRSVLAKLS
jgi:hypothetical protein